jgi:hypothetical protein
MRRSWLKSKLTETVILHQTNDLSYRGVLAGVWADGVTLRHAELLNPKPAAPTSMAGEVWVPREMVAIVQHGE